MAIIAIDPGNEKSAVIVFDGERIVNKLYAENADVLHQLRMWENRSPLVIEMIASYGMAVGAEVFGTCVWVGRFMQEYGPERTSLMFRLKVKQHLCHDSRAKDGNIRQAIIDRFGGKDKAIGKKHSPGPLFGISGDLWAALAVAITWWDQAKIEGKIA